MTYDKHDCDLMCERLAAYIEGDLPPAEQARRRSSISRSARRARRRWWSCARSRARRRSCRCSHRRATCGPASRHGSRRPSRVWTARARAVRRAPRRQWQFAIAAGALIAVTRGHDVPAHGAPGHDGLAPGVTVATTTPTRRSRIRSPRLLPRLLPRRLRAADHPRAGRTIERVAHHRTGKTERHPRLRSRDRAARQPRAHAARVARSEDRRRSSKRT